MLLVKGHYIYDDFTVLLGVFLLIVFSYSLIRKIIDEEFVQSI
jgi:hypothetical protein